MFSKSKPAAPPTTPTAHGPLRGALDAHLATMSAIDRERSEVNERATGLLTDIDAADAVGREVQALAQRIDAKAVAAAVDGTAPVDLTADREALARLTQRHAELEQRAAIARAARAELQSKSEALLQQYRPLQPQLARLCHDAVVESMIALAPALRDADREYRAVLRRVFLHAAAADQLSTTNHIGTFLDAQRFELHVLAPPRHAAFDAVSMNRFQVHEDYMQLRKDADVLIGRILQGADTDA